MQYTIFKILTKKPTSYIIQKCISQKDSNFNTNYHLAMKIPQIVITLDYNYPSMLIKMTVHN